MLKQLCSSASDEWPTSPKDFAKLDRRYHFTLDPCATPDNAKCDLYFTREQDGLAQDWGEHRVFCNPPYGKAINAWVRKCWQASQAGAFVVALLPARVDTRWFHDWVQGKAKVKFIRGRLRFGPCTQSAPFPSMLAVYEPRPARTCAKCGDLFIGRRDALTCSNACRQASYRGRLLQLGA